MPIAETIRAPTWVSSGAVITGGLDLLGLRLPVQFIGGTLLDGVTTVTPSVRYLAFRAWLIHRYGQSGQPDRWQDFTNFAARIESALVLGNLSQDRSIGGLIGTDQALARLDANTPRVAISALVKSPASTIICPTLGSAQPAAPVNPHELICHLEESPVSVPHFGSPHAGSLSLTGILRLLFEAEIDDSKDSAAAQDEQLDEGQLPDDSEKQEPKKTSEKQRVKPDDALVEARFRERLAAQIDTFLKELSSPTFAERCTATQMVQAVSFPLAVALRGQRRGWVSGELAEKLALEIFSILFRGTGAGGLLHVVEKRYADSGHQSTFGDVVGDGTLWLVLVATLGNADWQGVGTDVDKALALREVFTAPQLLASAQSGRIASLLGKVRIEDAHAYITDIAPKVSRLLHEIEGLLAPIWNAEMHVQTDRSITHKVGDLLWRENVGWAICLADTEARSGQAIKVRLRGLDKAVMVGYYVNVTELAGRRPDLARLLDQLREAASRSLGDEPNSSRL